MADKTIWLLPKRLTAAWRARPDPLDDATPAERLGGVVHVVATDYVPGVLPSLVDNDWPLDPPLPGPNYELWVERPARQGMRGWPWVVRHQGVYRLYRGRYRIDGETATHLRLTPLGDREPGRQPPGFRAVLARIAADAAAAEAARLEALLPGGRLPDDDE